MAAVYILAAAYEESLAALQYSTCNSRTLLHLLQVTTHPAPNYLSNRPLHCLTKLSFALAFSVWSMYRLVECNQRTGFI